MTDMPPPIEPTLGGAPPPPPPTTLAPAGAPVAVSQVYGRTLPPGVSIVTPGMRLVAYLLEAILVTITLGIGWLIWAAIIAGGGQTPAKKILGQRVIKADGSAPVGFGTMLFMRGLVAGFVAGIAITFTLGILLFMPFWDKRNQNIWDKVSGTLVVNDPANAWQVS